MKQRYRYRRGLGMIGGPHHDDNPLTIMANLFETGLVFALGFMVSLISAMNLLDMFNPETKVTVTTERKDGMQIMVKEGNKTTIRRLTKNVGAGDGTRLGVAYRLADGSVIYVPENEKK
ncbi:DUF2149 domain-containing protein [Runella slithyformis]|uniref:DUF2149 domain-containing protein n=1 Tax=Runella slithyformis (strain ATCC 29530 / DSM 19594 / LMG 11500 / NCIMB 11436 / LSU 4) TaxID=761193 RepID=A0A7U4E8Q9_RUNSL|nr:DUF2149 domain-containing protein [Runella slithyformis]AEI51956.1 Protein of unknown function DUF2149 [Runella slithyformis DSM 19594]